MKNLFFLIAIFLSVTATRAGTSVAELAQESKTHKMPVAYIEQAIKLYDSLQLQKAGLEKEIFLKAYKGYIYLLNRGLVSNSKMLSIADFSQSSKNKRLYIIDLKKVKLVFNTWVSHGKNSGAEMATSFSNVKDSYKSTLGFLITADTYTGSAGYSLRFRGMEEDINDNVRDRAIIVHGSKFVNEQTARSGMVGNSLGCPAVPMAQSKSIINTIKGGSVYFIYHPNETYNATSHILNASINPQPLLLPSVSMNGSDSLSVAVSAPL